MMYLFCCSCDNSEREIEQVWYSRQKSLDLKPLNGFNQQEHSASCRIIKYFLVQVLMNNSSQIWSGTATPSLIVIALTTFAK